MTPSQRDRLQNQTIRLAAVNNVPDGGVTYSLYLKSVIDGLPDSWDITVFHTKKTGMSAQEGEAFFEGYKVVYVDHDVFFSHLSDFDILISNDAHVGRFIDESIVIIMLVHGAAPMPSDSAVYAHSHWIAYWDAVFSSSRTNTKMIHHGMSRYRRMRRSFKMAIAGEAIRSDIRTTMICPSKPLKYLDVAGEPPELNPARFVIGFLPTLCGVTKFSLSLYSTIAEFMPLVTERFPEAKILFRPYPSDLASADIQAKLEPLRNQKSIVIDSEGGNVAEFFDQCDFVISDGSTGGISFLLRRRITPIYYLPQAGIDEDPSARMFRDSLDGIVLFAYSPEELVQKIFECRMTSADRHFETYQNYINQELYLDHDPARALIEIYKQAHGEGEKFSTVGSQGSVTLPSNGDY